ncbi:CDF family Co(II)/Ni(II) efflux transporter DmeF [Methylophaga sp. OBS4]|uniref:CDF family Co(II)/Ni(II) efflux transporter DmeF n=1 Tax=Methylophaga sp. OBS4 TaxID=2991935 RepID=UPI002252F0AB|nr:CDF family Co(II)/Ni(II) efflux transporter DmeF [Methylophaga sp. OBS4]MCX4186461.1 CDF family Co(II)/Ni(II) efflux transporter DmeF [Methylophaga sp. OBS4]
MHQHSVEQWQQDHDFVISNKQGERRTRYVLILTAVTMLAEIIAGTVFGSMALLADGWHMATHVAAFMITLFAYHYASKHADNPAFAFGTGKVSVLGGFTSAIALAVVALMLLVESIERLLDPQTIQFNAAIAVAIVGLTVNLLSALLLKDYHHHHDQKHHDHNLKAAYVHVLADALTSVLAIVALLSAKFLGLLWLDPMMGIVGATIITAWAISLIRETSPILLDGSIDQNYQQAIRQRIENDADNRIADFHIWHVSAHHYAAIVTIVTAHPQATSHYKNLLSEFDRLSHLTIEVHQCLDKDCEHHA